MFAIVDIEATGGSPKTARIMEIAIIIHNGERVIEEFSTLVNPEQAIDPFVIALTGISNEMVEHAPNFEAISKKILELTENRIIVAHNVRFDYNFLKNEFKRIGIRFQRRFICTVKMSRKFLPGHSSYSLGKLCKDLKIPIKNRHRALGDAAATAVLLEKLLFTDKKQLITSTLSDELAQAHIPENLSKDVVNDLPEETGVYFFYNKDLKPIYIGKSKNIRSRVLSHFSANGKSARTIEMNKNIYSIDYVLTGNELIAELLESGEIKKWMPEFNRAQRRKTYRYGLFKTTDKNGYDRLSVQLLHPDREPVLKFTTKRWADQSLKELKIRNKLNQESRLNLPPEQYNNQVLKSIKQFSFEEPNLLIIDSGRNYEEKSVVLIRDGKYVGFGYATTEHQNIEDVQQLMDCVQADFVSPDKERIVQKYLRKKNNFHLIPFDDE